MRLRLWLLFALLSIIFLSQTVEAAQKPDDSDVEGSANVDNPDDEDFGEDSSGLPPDDEDHKKEPAKPIKDERVPPKQPTPGPPIYPTTVILKPGSTAGANDQWSLDLPTIVLLLGAFVLVLFIIVIVVVCVRKRSRKSEYIRGNRQQYV